MNFSLLSREYTESNRLQSFEHAVTVGASIAFLCCLLESTKKARYCKVTIPRIQQRRHNKCQNQTRSIGIPLKHRPTRCV